MISHITTKLLLILIFFSFLFSRLQIRVYGLLCILALSYWLYKTRFPTTKVIVPEKLQEKWHSLYSSFNKLRNDKPGAFCTIVSLGLIVLAIFGHIVSGQWIVLSGLMVAGLISTKHQIKFVNEKSGMYVVVILCAFIIIRRQRYFYVKFY